MCRLDCSGNKPVSLHDISPSDRLCVYRGRGFEMCCAGKCCCFYTPLRAIEADVRNAPDIVNLNVKYPVEYSAGIREKEWRGSGMLQSKAKGCC